MRDIVTNFLFFNPLNLTGLVFIALGVIWFGLIAVTMFSIAAQQFGGGAKLGWALVVVCVPLVGLYAYTFYCLFSADHEWTKKFRR